jgi:hypothetical protein
MSHPLTVYLQDHLAGARFAVSLLEELANQDLDPETARIADRLLPEILADRQMLEELTKGSSRPSKSCAWVCWESSPYGMCCVCSKAGLRQYRHSIWINCAIAPSRSMRPSNHTGWNWP